MKILKCNINNKNIEIAIDERESLLETLRDRLGLFSVKRGCEVGECGACSVVIDKKIITSCTFLAAWAEGKKIYTSEGLLNEDGSLSNIQQAFVDETAVQCGFCTPGFIMAAKAMEMTNKKYTREEIRVNISGNLCRCTGYENILNAIEKVVGKK